MLYLVRHTVTVPESLSSASFSRLMAAEKEYSQNAQAQGVIKEIWRVTGQSSNYCLYNVADNDHLHTVISGLPLFPYLDIEVTPLSAHPNSIRPKG